MTQKELEQLFSQYGRIITSRILVDQVTGEVFLGYFLPLGQCHQPVPCDPQEQRGNGYLRERIWVISRQLFDLEERLFINQLLKFKMGHPGK